MVYNKPSTQASHRMVIREHLFPFFRHTPLREIEREDILRFIAQQRKKTLSAKTINNQLTTLRKMLNCAVDWGYLARSPMQGVKQLKEERTGFDFYTEEETQRFLDICQETEPFWYPFFLCATTTGMRLGELRALRWKDFHFDSNVILVQRSVWRHHEGTTKSGKERQIPLHPTLRETLATRRGRPKDFVFRTRQGKPLTRNSMRKPFRRIQQGAGLQQIRFHDLRHSFASQLVMKGVPIRVVQELLGHSTIQMTEIYSHLAPNVNQDAIEKLFEHRSATKGRHVLGTVVDIEAFRRQV